jgi:DNA-binding transcriptional LysR family regulator
MLFVLHPEYIIKSYFGEFSGMKKRELNFDLKQLRSYLAVLHEKNFTRASRKLKRGQATISHHIQSLEEMLGVKLIERTSTAFSVTDDGKTFKAFCEKLFTDIEKLTDDLEVDGTGGTSRIAASTIPSTYLLPRVIAALSRDCDDLYYRVEISDSREVVEMVKEGVAEMGISGRQFKHSSLTYEHVFSDEIVLIGTAEFPDSMAIDDVKDLSLVGRERGSGTRNAYENALSKLDILPSELRMVLECSTTESVKEAVVSGIGAAFISSLAIEKELRLKMLKIIEIKGFSIERDFYVLYLNNKHLSVAAQKLLHALRALKA